jgi:chitinase
MGGVGGGEGGVGGGSGTGGGEGGVGGGSGGTGGGEGGGGGPVGSIERVVGYFAEWAVYDRMFFVSDLPADKMTHVNYAFARITDGKCAVFDSWAATDNPFGGEAWDAPLKGNFHQLQLLKAAHPNLRTLISVGGWTLSGSFSDVALTDASRKTFAESCVDFMVQYGFDGIDIDWEYPAGGGLETNTSRPEDTQNFTLLLKALRDELTARQADEGRDEAYLLTIAAPAGPGNIAHVELDKIHEHLDWINIMTYDFHGGFDSITGFNAPMYAQSNDPSTDEDVRLGFNVDAAVQAYIEGGVPRNKIVVGMPFYGRSWMGVGATDNGLYQTSTGPGPGTWISNSEGYGVLDYKDIVANYLPTYTRYWDDEAQVPYLYNPSTGVFITYDDPESLGIKRQYVLDEGLGGVMIWEMSSDDSDALLDAIR